MTRRLTARQAFELEKVVRSKKPPARASGEDVRAIRAWKRMHSRLIENFLNAELVEAVERVLEKDGQL